LIYHIFPNIIQPNTDAEDPMKDSVKETSLRGSSLIDYLFLQNNKVWRGIGALHNLFFPP